MEATTRATNAIARDDTLRSGSCGNNSSSSSSGSSSCSSGSGSTNGDKDSSSFPTGLVLVGAASCLLAATIGSYYCWQHYHRLYRGSSSSTRGRSHGRKGSNNNNDNDNNNNNNNDNVNNWEKPRTRAKTKTKNNNSYESGDNDDDDDHNSTSSSSSSFELPQHIQRELYKEERRKASVRFLAMKKPLYENIEMYAPDGTTMLCTIGRKKANWYVRKSLAEWLRPPSEDIGDAQQSSGGDTTTPVPSIRLLFEPKNRKAKKGGGGSGGVATNDNDNDNDNDESDYVETMRMYNCTHKQNICVSCGALDAMAPEQNARETPVTNDDDDDDDDRDPPGTSSSDNNNTGLMRHYVVPYSYRRLLPKKFKSHMPHDVVLLCLDCHIDAEQAAKIHRTDVYERLYRTDPATASPIVIDPRAKAVKSRARALWQHRRKLPESRIADYEKYLVDYVAEQRGRSEGRSETDGASSFPVQQQQLSEDALKHLALTVEPERPNPNYVPLAALVVENLCRTDEEIRDFVKGWRQFFVDTLQPRHLPVGWSVDSPVRVDVDADDDDVSRNAGEEK